MALPMLMERGRQCTKNWIVVFSCCVRSLDSTLPASQVESQETHVSLVTGTHCDQQRNASAASAAAATHSSWIATQIQLL